MAKKVLQASIKVSENPRVRFYARGEEKSGKNAFVDVTHKVVKLVLEQLDKNSEACALLRLDAQNKLVWRTEHQSIQEAKWHVEFEYGLPEEKWAKADDEKEK
jgi:xanthine/CO dehydrogenase XdhC/CoxF family maturation factor